MDNAFNFNYCDIKTTGNAIHFMNIAFKNLKNRINGKLMGGDMPNLGKEVNELMSRFLKVVKKYKVNLDDKRFHPQHKDIIDYLKKGEQ